MSTKDETLTGLIAYLKERVFPGVPSIPRTRDELLVFLREEGAHLLHWKADKLQHTSQTATAADPYLRMNLAGRAKAMRAMGDLMRATIVRPEDIEPQLEEDFEEEEDDFVDVEYTERRRRPRNSGRGGSSGGWPNR